MHNVLEKVGSNGYCDLTSQELGVVREARLMGKIDHRENLPNVMRDNNLSILTTSNRTYRIGAFQVFQELPTQNPWPKKATQMNLPFGLQTLNAENLSGEAATVNAAHASGMIGDFCGEPVTLTVAGRMRTPAFEFSVDTNAGAPQSLRVQGAQIEIDAGFEGTEAFCIFEVKNHAPKNFNLRQLYYPLRTWEPRISKPIKPIFLTFSNDVFDFYEYAFENLEDYSSAELVRHESYMLTHDHIDETDLSKMASSGLGSLSNPDVPFIQADKVERVIDLVSILLEGPKDIEDLALHYGFDTRQSDYYFNAARFLGLAETARGKDGRIVRQATKLSRDIFSQGYREKYLSLASLVLGIDSVARTYLVWKQSSNKPSRDNVIAILRDSSDSVGISGQTIGRRSQTVLAWAEWAIFLPSQ